MVVKTKKLPVYEQAYTTPPSSRSLLSFTTGRGVAVVNGVHSFCRRRVDNVAFKLVLMLVLL